jgi:hypothetical protein
VTYLKYLPIFSLFFFGTVSAQNSSIDSIFKYQYSIIDTPYGDYYGLIILKREGQSYRGEIIDEDGTINSLKVTKFDENWLIFKSKIDGAKSVFRCEIFGDSIRGVGTFSNDEFKFFLKGKRVKD